MIMDEKEERIIKWIFRTITIVCAVALGYAYALNGRYMYLTGGAVFDKWNRTVIYKHDLVNGDGSKYVPENQ